MWKGFNLNSLVKQVFTTAPQNPLLKFKEHWAKVDGFYKTFPDSQAAPRKLTYYESQAVLRNVEIFNHLCSMLDILSQEDLRGTSEPGPCLETFLQMRVMDALCSYAIDDKPLGSLNLILKVIVKLFGCISQPLIPHQNVRGPLFTLLDRTYLQLETFRIGGYQEKVAAGDSSTAASLRESDYFLNMEEVRKQFVELLWALSCKVEADTMLVDFFYAEEGLSSDTVFLPLKYMLSGINDSDQTVGEKARNGLLCCVRIPDSNLDNIIASHSQFCEELARGLASLHARCLSEATRHGVGDNSTNPYSKALKERIRYVNHVARVAGDLVLEKLTRNLSSMVFESGIAESLLVEDNKLFCAGLSLTRMFLSNIDSLHVARSLLNVLLGALHLQTEPEERDSDIADGERVRFVLFERLHDPAEECVVGVLQLLDMILARFPSEVLYSLVVRNLEKRGHLPAAERLKLRPLKVEGIPDFFPRFFSPPPPPADGSSSAGPSNSDENLRIYTDDAMQQMARTLPVFDEWFDDMDNEYSDVGSVRNAGSASVQLSSSSSSSSSVPTPSLSASEAINAMRTRSRAASSALIGPNPHNLSMSGLPPSAAAAIEAAITAASDPDDSVNKSALQFTAQRDSSPNSLLLPSSEDSLVQSPTPSSSSAVSDFSQQQQQQQSPEQQSEEEQQQAEAVAAEQEEEEEEPAWLSDESTPFYEGRFLEIIFDFVDNMFSQSEVVNLLVTSILSRLIQIPHATLHSYLLDKNLPVREGVRSLPRILSDVTSRANQRALRHPNFDKVLNVTRKVLGLDLITINMPAAPITGLASPLRGNSFNNAAAENVEEDKKFMQSLILLDEFRKELTAMLSVKYKLHVMRRLRVPPPPDQMKATAAVVVKAPSPVVPAVQE